jgi:retron-type reverse transcriptase
MKILKTIKIEYRDRRTIRELYKHQAISIKTNESKREAAIRRGVRQGRILTPLLFNIYIEQAINKYKEYCTRIKVNRKRTQMLSTSKGMLRFVDDTAIIAQDEIN